MRKIFTIYLLFFIQFVSSQNTKWPFPNPNQTGKVTGPLGEFRGNVTSPRFHRGNDLKADGNTETNTEKSVHSINSGNISFNAAYNSSNLPDPWSSYVKVNDVFYYHIWPSNDIQNEILTFADVEDYLGEMITNNIDAHVHLQNSNTNYLQELVSYSDNSAPFFSSSYISNGLQLYKNGIQSNFSNNNDLLLNQYLNINNSQYLLVFDKIDITAHIKDYRTNPDGSGDTGEVSAFSLRWKIKNGNTIFLEDGYEYPTPPLNNDNAKYIFHHSSFSSTPYRSINIITADPYESNTFLKNQFANLRLRVGEIENFELRGNFRDPNLDSKINLQSIVKDNLYQIEVMGCDTSTNNLNGNCVSNQIDVVVDNFLPYIKKVTLSNTGGLIYEGEWNLNAMEDALEFDKCTIFQKNSLLCLWKFLL